MSFLPVSLTCSRMLIRWWQFRAYKVDDLFCCLALLCLLGYLAMAQWKISDTIPLDSVLLWRVDLACDMLFWSALYCVKASFLSLTWSIFKISNEFRKVWWTVSIYTLGTFLAIMLSQFWQCGNPPNPIDYDNPVVCQQTVQDVNAVYMKFAFHLSSECFILILPIAQIRKLNASFSKRLSIAAIFALVIIDILTGIVRNILLICILSISYETQATVDSSVDILYLIMEIIEPIIAVAVCALPAYRPLLSWSRKRRADQLELQHNAAQPGETEPHKLFVPISNDDLHSQMTKEVAHVI